LILLSTERHECAVACISRTQVINGRETQAGRCQMPVVLLGTLDTKGAEYQFVRDMLQSRGVESMVIDAGTQAPLISPDIGSDRLFAAAGASLEAVRRANDRGQAVEAAARGAARLIVDLHGQGSVHGILCLGGSAGTTIGTAAMRALPFGIPKLMVSTLASGQVKQWVGVRDILMMYSVVDISGLNRINRQVLTNAARAMVGMVTRAQAGPAECRTEQAGKLQIDNCKLTIINLHEQPLIATTMFGVTTPCVGACRTQLEAA